MRSEFEKWFKTTKFYENMIKSITTHEIKAHPFDRTGGKYKSIYVQLAFDSFKHQQSKMDELQVLYTQQGVSMLKLQKRVEELTVGCGLQRDHIKGLEAELKKAWTTVDQEGHKNHELVMLLKFVKEHFEMNGLDKAMPRVYEKLEQALKGGSDEAN